MTASVSVRIAGWEELRPGLTMLKSNIGVLSEKKDVLSSLHACLIAGFDGHTAWRARSHWHLMGAQLGGFLHTTF